MHFDEFTDEEVTRWKDLVNWKSIPSEKEFIVLAGSLCAGKTHLIEKEMLYFNTRKISDFLNVDGDSMRLRS